MTATCEVETSLSVDDTSLSIGEPVETRDDLALAHIIAASRAGRPVKQRELTVRFGIDSGSAWKLMRRLERRGLVQPLVGKDGWVAVEAASYVGAPPVSVSDLLALARANVDPSLKPRRGRQALHVSRAVHSITPGQLADIERLGLLVSRYAPGAADIPPADLKALLMWDDTANGGSGGWPLVAQVRRWAESEHRLKHEGRLVRDLGSSAPKWTAASAAATVRDYQGAANNLLHLATTHGLLTRDKNTAAWSGTLYAPCWAPAITRWARRVSKRGGAANPERVLLGCRTLAIYATAAGGRSVRDTDWLGVRRALLADGTSKHKIRRINAARYVWRLVVEEVGPRLGLGVAFEWPLKGDNPLSLVGSRAVTAAAVADVNMSSRDFHGWVQRDGSYASGLIEGLYGLRRWAAWSTLDDMLLRRQQPPLPPRAWAFESSLADRRPDQKPLKVADETLATRLRYFNSLAGWAARDRGIDWTCADGLLTLCDPDLVDAYVEWTITDRPKDPRGSGLVQLSDTVRSCAWVVNGFLAGQANISGDKAVLAVMQDWYHRLESIASEIPMPDHQDLRKVAANVLATSDAWKGADGVDGLKKLTAMLTALESELFDQAHGRTVAEQIDQVRSGAWVPGPQWAKTLRLMIVLLIAQRVPLRGRTLAHLELRHWKASPVGPIQKSAEAAGLHRPWQGGLTLEIEGRLMKSRREFTPALILPENVATEEQAGSSAHEAAIRRDLLELWFCDGGGRDVCRTAIHPDTGDTTRLDVPWLFPDAIGDDYYGGSSPSADGKPRKRGQKTRNRSRPGLWTRARLSAAFRRAVIRHGDELGIDLKALRKVRGGFGLHVIRRLFGSYWAVRNLIMTSRLLDHTKITMTATIYCAQDVRTMSLDVAAAP